MATTEELLTDIKRLLKKQNKKIDFFLTSRLQKSDAETTAAILQTEAEE